MLKDSNDKQDKRINVEKLKDKIFSQNNENKPNK